MAEFVNEFKTDEWEVETPTGWQSFSGIGETIPYVVWKLKTINHILDCADKHIVYKLNHELDIPEGVFVQDLKIGDHIFVDGENTEQIISVEETKDVESMYDLMDVDGGNIYYTNGILSHNTTTVTSYLLHYILFNQSMNVAILANKQSTAKDILARLKLAYEYLPTWLQQGIKEWNKYSIALENGSRVLAAATSSSAIRGGSYNFLVLDEYAHVPTNVAEEFFSSVYPTITSGQTTKVAMISTPKGLNMFYHFWKGAQSKQNEYIPIEVTWNQVPKYPGGPLRDEVWKQETIRNSSERQFSEEFECVDENTLITVRDKITKKEHTITIKDAFDFLY